MTTPQARFKTVLVGAIAVTVIAAVIPLLPSFQALDLLMFDLQTNYLRATSPIEQSPEVVIVGIDEKTESVFLEPMSLWHGHFGALFSALAAGEPAVVGLDVTLPDRSFDAWLPGADRRLLEGILALKRVAPVVLGQTVEADGSPQAIYPPFVSVAGEGSVGFVLWDLDPDRVVRRFSENLADDGSAVATLVGRLTHRLGLEPEAGMIDCSRGASFEYLSMHEVIAWHEQGDSTRLKQAVVGRPVLIGSVLPFVDRHYQPVNLAGWEDNQQFVSGVLIHAQALRCQLAGWMIRPVQGWPLVLLCCAAAQLWWPSRRPGVGLALLVIVVVAWTTASLILFRQGLWLPLVSVTTAAGIAVVGRILHGLIEQAEERRRLRLAFGGYVSPSVMEEILQGHLQPGLGGERRTICVLFSDIRGFTNMSEGMEPEQVIDLLNRYFQEWVTAIQQEQGTVDKFIGDGIMGFFGAPKSSDNPAQAAFASAIDMLDRLEELNRSLESEGQAALKIGIGLHLGDTVVGHVGAADRHEYTAIGDTVNVASRLEGLTKELGSPLACSREVVEALAIDGFESVGKRPLKGHTPVEVFAWRGGDKE